MIESPRPNPLISIDYYKVLHKSTAVLGVNQVCFKYVQWRSPISFPCLLITRKFFFHLPAFVIQLINVTKPKCCSTNRQKLLTCKNNGIFSIKSTLVFFQVFQRIKVEFLLLWKKSTHKIYLYRFTLSTFLWI